MGYEVFTFDVMVQLEEGPSFDRACQQARKLAGEEVEKYRDEYEKKSGEWISQDSMTITFRSYAEEVDYRFQSVYSYVFSVTVRLI